MKLCLTLFFLAIVCVGSSLAQAPASPRRRLSSSGSKPDVIISALKAFRRGEDRVDYEWIITNIGDAPLNLDGKSNEDHDNLCVQAYMSKDTVFDPDEDIPAGGTIVGVSPLGDLAPGESIAGKFSCTLKARVEEYPILTLKVDHHDAFEESNDANNFAAVGIAPAKERLKKAVR